MHLVINVNFIKKVTQIQAVFESAFILKEFEYLESDFGSIFVLQWVQDGKNSMNLSFSRFF